MECPKCKIVEMRLDKVDDEKMYFTCKKCGEEVIKTIEEVEKEGE